MKLRERTANMLVRLARRIDPPNKAAMQFYMDRLTDFVLTGHSAIKVSVVEPEDYYAPTDPAPTA